MSSVNLRLLKTEPEVGALRFGPFELDVRTGELRKSGVRVKLQLQPARVLTLLAFHPGVLLTREEIQSQVWDDGTYVDFEQSLNFCIRQIRAALGDQAGTPRYVETLPRRGYRFVAPVETVPAGLLTGAPPEALPATDPGGGPTPPSTSAEPPRPQARRVVALLLLLLAAAGFLVTWGRPAPPLPAFERLTFRRGSITSARFAPDGQVIYGAAWEGGSPRFYSVRLESRDSGSLDVTSGFLVGVSREGEIAFLADSAQRGMVLARGRLEGGPHKEILEGVYSADWYRDATQFAVARRGPKGAAQIELPVGNVVGEAIHPTSLRVSPDGERVALLEHPVPRDDRGFVVVMDATGGRMELTDTFSSIDGLAWAPNGKEVWFTGAKVGADSALQAVRLDGHVRTLVPALGRLVIHDVAPDGRALVERVALRHEMLYGTTGLARERDLSWFDVTVPVDISADGKQVLFFESGEGGGPEYSVFLRSTDGSSPVRLGHGAAKDLSPDGRWVLSIPIVDTTRIELLPTGPGEVRTVRDPLVKRFLWAGFLGHDDRIIFTAEGNDGTLRSYVKTLPDGPSEPVTPDGIGAWAHSVSPDGAHFVASCGKQTCLYSLEGGEPRSIPNLRVARQVVGWGPDGRWLYVVDGPMLPLRISRLDLATGERSPVRELQPLDRAGVRYVSGLAITPDGRSYTYSCPRSLCDLYVVSGLR
jgi:DNA-binding winged helix-turn-helix (wHTH) protein/Tol biopolymer transport system component